MAADPRQQKKWLTTMPKKITEALKSSIMKIVPAHKDSLDSFLIMFKLTGGNYNGQTHILQMITNNHKNILYPITAPGLTFLSDILHPNVAPNGHICLDILKPEAWSPVLSIETIVSVIITLLDDPNPSSPLDDITGKLYTKCNKMYTTNNKNLTVVEQTELYKKCFSDYVLAVNSYYKKNTKIKQYLYYFDEIEVTKDISEMKIN